MVFQDQDFSVFHVEGLEPRMEAIKTRIRPKFEWIGERIAPFLAMKVGAPIYVHIAKHARRTVHPPDETWLAWSTNKRGYKALPHFQVGIRDAHVFIWFALIYECEGKAGFARRFLDDFDRFWDLIPDHFAFSKDHTVPETYLKNEMAPEDLKQMLERLATVKKAEFLCGLLIPKHQAVHLDPSDFASQAEHAFETVMPLYRLATSE